MHADKAADVIILRRIASALNVPVADFFDPAKSGSMDHDEVKASLRGLLRAEASVPNAEMRKRVLAAIACLDGKDPSKN